MGLFDRNKNKDNDQTGNLGQYAGMRVEVMNERGYLLFIAYINVDWDKSVRLRPIVQPRIAPGIQDLPVIMRGYETAVKKAVHMEGTISPGENGDWLVEDFVVTGKDNDRAFFRQETAMSGSLISMRIQSVTAIPCRVINVSAGGVCFWAQEKFLMGEKLLLKSSLFEDWRTMSLMCAVRRIIPRKNLIEYGCEFVQMNPTTEDMIAKAIMDMQIKRMREQ